MVTRRQFLSRLGAGAATMVVYRTGGAQQSEQFFNGPMEQGAYRPVKLVAKAGAVPSMTDAARDDLEHRIKCQCGCILDVYTCRTTDFSCAVSPAMHADVMGLVAGGYAASEILSAFQAVYGEQVLMSPIKEGFNLVGYIMPFAVLISAGAIVGALIRRWGARSRQLPHASAPAPIDATPEELDALAAAMRDET